MGFPYLDTRSFIDDAERVGELVRVKEEVDWNLELSAIVRRIAEVGKGRGVKGGGQPAVLFEKIKDCPEGFRLLGGSHLNIVRTAMMFGIKDPDKATYRDIQEAYLYALNHPIKPEIVEGAPCKENKVFKEKVNVYDFPTPMISEGDGGRYFSRQMF